MRVKHKTQDIVKLFLATTILCIFLISCNGHDTAGTYVNQRNPNDILILRPDKTFYYHAQFELNAGKPERSYEGTYEVDGDLIILRNNDGALWKPLKIVGDKIQLSDNPSDLAARR